MILDLFQSHAGSIEAGRSRRFRWGSRSFQSHAGSIEAEASAAGTNPSVSFQSHAGSIEALGVAAALLLPVFLSIPRWFD